MDPELNKNELSWFCVGHSYGSNQEMMSDPWLRFGGCAAITAVDSSIYFALQMHLKKSCPYKLESLNQRLYNAIAAEMKPYLRPRFMGVNRLDIYTDGFGKWLQDHGETSICMDCFYLQHTEADAENFIKDQINSGLPIPFLLLSHKLREMKDWQWHWFLLTGYEKNGSGFRVKAVTYGAYEWLDFHVLWDTGYEQDGGMVKYILQNNI